MKILVGDIGGTKTLLQVAEFTPDNHCHVLREHAYASDHPDPMQIFRHFLQGAPAVDAACFGVAGPVTGDAAHQQAQVTNLPWRLDNAALAAELNIPRVRLINDFQAVGYAIESLKDRDVVVLQGGEPQPQGTRALIGAGTGLGEGLLVWHNDHYEVLASEGGHVDFAPQDGTQAQLLEYLSRQYDHVSYERVVSGPGLVNIYTFLRQAKPGAESADLARAMREGDPAAAISEFALWREDELAQQTLTQFVRIYGAQAGNLALTTLARGGVYIAGGIAPKIIDFMNSNDFLQAFNSKGRMQPLMQSIPVKVILNSRVGLIGAATVARRL